MAVSFNIAEIFEIAEQIERNGAAYYRQAAENTDDKSVRQLFSQLAEMEDNHEKIFAEMRQRLADATETNVFDPDNEMAYYLRAMAASAGWEGKAAARIQFSGKERPEEIIRAALAAEKNSVDYYLGLKEMVTEKDKPKVEKIIKEEMGHIVTLQKNLEQLSA